MLSYRHGYHAGNAADVLKHFILLYVLDYVKKKDKKKNIIIALNIFI